MTSSYLIRYGLMARVGRFVAEPCGLMRGETVVIRTSRGTELGEVLLEIPAATLSAAALAPSSHVLRVAQAGDRERSRQLECDRDEHFAICQRVFADGHWPLEFIDVEPMFEARRTVLYYLGPHHLDVSGLLASFRARYNLDVHLEPVGRDADDMDVPAESCGTGGCGSCGSSGGGCGSSGVSGHSGCSDCGVKKLIAESRAVASR